MDRDKHMSVDVVGVNEVGSEDDVFLDEYGVCEDDERVKDVVQVEKVKRRFHGGDNGQGGDHWTVAVDRLLGPGGRLGSWRTGTQSRQTASREFNPSKEEYTAAEMNEFDENGWAHVHQAAFRGFVKSVERFINTDNEQLELETTDDLHSTPLLLAVMSGNLDTVKCLVEMGAKVYVTNSQNHGVVELCAFKQFINVLEYFLELNHERLPVWKSLIKFVSSELDEECEAAAKCLRTLTQGTSEEMNPNWKPAYENAIVPAINKIIKGSIGELAKIATLQVLLNLLPSDEVKDQFCSAAGMAALVKLLKGSNSLLVQLAAEAIKVLSYTSTYAELAVRENAIPALVRVVQTVRDPECLVEVVQAIGSIVNDNPGHQQALNTHPGAVQSIVGLYEDQANKPLLTALTESITKMVKFHEANQNHFVSEGVSVPIINLMRNKNLELQVCAVACIHRLADDNPHTQRLIVEEGVVLPLMQLLKKSRQQYVQERTAGALWALAGSNMEEKRSMASMMGTQLLIEFLSSLSEELHYIGSEATGVLATGPLNKQDAIAQANGVHPCVRLLRADKEHIVLSVIRTIRYLCVAVGYVPHARNQTTIAQSRGIKFLVALMIHSRSELIQVEAAHTLGLVSLGHQANSEELKEHPDFSYVRILKMMYSQEPDVRLAAGSALAAFAYNSLANQKDIADQGGVRFSCFVPFLESADEFQRCTAAFQVVVISRIIPDEEQAISSAAGIKLLVDLLHDSASDDVLALACDSIARLAHTRAGIPSAFVSIDTVNYLCDLLENPVEQVRGCAAIALGYLSYHPLANRQLLSSCRTDPVMMRIIRYYTQRSKLSPDFIEGWKHYKQIGLPPIEEGRLNLVGKKSVQYKDFVGRPLTITSNDDTAGGSTNIHSSPTVFHTSGGHHDDDKSHLTVHSSMSSRRMSRASVMTPRQSHMSQGQGHLSVASHRSRQNSVLSVSES